MSLSPAEAHLALKDIEKTENRAAASQHHRVSAPYLIMWGIVWVIGYAVTASAPRLSWIWAPLIIGAVIGSVILGGRQPAVRNSAYGWRYGASFVAIALFIGSIIAIARPLNYNQVSALFPPVSYTHLTLPTKRIV